jgi:signal transduction histidine kinase
VRRGDQLRNNMQNDNRSTLQPRRDGRAFQQWQRMPLALLVLGMISIAMLIWTNRLIARQRMNFALVHALQDMRIQTATFHLWLETALSGELHEDIKKTLGRIDLAISLAEVILNGGEPKGGANLEPLHDPGLLVEAQHIKSLLTRFKSIAEARYRQLETTGTGPPQEDEFHKVFEEFAKKAGLLEALVETDQAISQTKSRRLSFGILLVWALVVVAATTGLWTREWRRKVAEDALQASNAQLQSQAEELSRHRSHLLELVEERTADLTAANSDLQEEIVERRRAVEALQESKDKFERLSLVFRTLLDAIPDALMLLSPELKIMWANRGAASMFGKSIPELTGLRCCDPWDSRSALGDDYPAVRAFRSGSAESAQISAPDGSLRDTRVFPIKDGQGQVESVIEIATDVTEKLIHQAEAQRVARLASLGELAAGVAHEINNPINGIINYAQILTDDCRRAGEESEIPDRIIKEGNRIATIVRSLLSFAHESQGEKMPAQIKAILADTLALSGKQLEKDGIAIKLSVPDQLPAIKANPQQIEQVFLNIVNNARHALNQKHPGSNENKVLEISVEEMTVYGCHLIQITFHDLGTGIPAGIIDRVMDPFFSTKPEGTGTGLGLSISHGIIADHGGRLVIRSVDGEFTKVQVILPVEEKNASKNPRNR